MTEVERLTALSAGTQLLVGGNQLVTVTPQLAAKFRDGDVIYVAPGTRDVLHVPAAVLELVRATVDRSCSAFTRMGAVSDLQISEFFAGFAARLASEEVWREIALVNQKDVERARGLGRSTTRLVATDKMRAQMVSGLEGWQRAASVRGKVLERVDHDGFQVELVGAELGVVGFVFEGRPNVVADATGVLRGGNAVVFRIGSDALDTARAILDLALTPALEAAGLPRDAVSLVDSLERSAGWALFSDRRLSLAVARGSGPAVATLGGLARQAGVPVSLHGTGGAWIVAGESASTEALENAVFASLDRKVCNTLNTACLPVSQAARLLPALLRGLERAAARREQPFKLHVTREHESQLPAGLFEREVTVRRAEGDVREKQAELLDEADLGLEWEWEEAPEISLTFVASTERAVELCNRYSPNFVASLISDDSAEHERFYQTVNTPFVGDGFTRWVDGQFALKRPELGLSNWQHGRLFGRGGILSGDSVYTLRTRYITGSR